MAGFLYDPWTLMPTRFGDKVYPPKSHDAGWGFIILQAVLAQKGAFTSTGKRSPQSVWRLAVMKAADNQVYTAFFRDSGELFVYENSKEKGPAWCREAAMAEAARRNPGRRGGGVLSRGRARGGDMFSPVATMPLQQATQAQTFDTSSGPIATSPFRDTTREAQTSNVGPGMEKGPERQVPDATISVPSKDQGLFTPQREEPPGTLISEPGESGGKPVYAAQSPDTWTPEYRTDIYTKFIGSTTSSPTSEAKLMRQLIDPQLWRLADGGSVEAMYELQRRGPSHYRPAFPNPRSRRNPLAQQIGEKNAGIVNNIAKSILDGVGSVDADHIPEEMKPFLRAEIKRLKAEARRNPRGQRDIEMLIGEDGAEWAQYDQERRGIYHRNAPRRVRNVPRRRNPRMASFVGGGRGLRMKDLTRGRQLPPAPPVSRKRPGYGAFLKPGTTSWPAWEKSKGWDHAEVAIQWMTRGMGSPSDYPALIVNLARYLPPSLPGAKTIWSMYSRNRKKIEAKAGRKMPTLAQLRRS